MSKKGNLISAVLASAVLFSGTALLAAYSYLKKGEHDEEPVDDQAAEEEASAEETAEAEEAEEAEEAVEEPAEEAEEAEEAVEEPAEEAAEAVEEAVEPAEEAVEAVEEIAEEAEPAEEVEPEETAPAEEAVELAAEAPEEAGDAFAEYAEKPEEPAELDLESYLAEHPEEEESLKAVSESFSADGVRTDITVTGNTMFFDFVMTDVDDEDTADALKPDLEGFLDDQSEAYSDIVRTMEDETGIDNVKMIVIFMDDDENEIVSGHYDSEGRVL